MDSRQPLGRFLLVALLTASAIAQPLFDLFGRQAEFLVAQELSPAGLAAFAVILGILVPGAVAMLPLLISRIAPRTGGILFYLLFLLLSALVALQALRTLPAQGAVIVAVALVSALAVALLYRRSSAVRMFFSYLSPAVLVFPLVFLFFSRATPLLSGGEEAGVAGQAPIRSRHDVVLLVLDEFPVLSLLTREMEINAQRYPNFARLAGMSNWYRLATTGAETTVDAVPSLLSGLHPDPDREVLPIAANFPRNLFTLLQHDYRMSAGETATRLCPGDLCSAGGRQAPARRRSATLVNDLALVYLHLVTPEPWSGRLPSISTAWTGFAGDGVSPAAGSTGQGALAEARALAELSANVSWRTRAVEVEAFIASIDRGGAPGLHYLHTLLPHAIWRYLPDGRQYLLQEDWEAIRRDTGLAADVWHDDRFAVHQQWQRHLLQVQYVDTLLGRLLDHMEARGMMDSTLLVVAGDHGASFVPGHPRRSVDRATLADIAYVPLFIHLPGQDEGVIDDRPATLADVLPTIMEVLDAEPGWPLDGASLLGTAPEREALNVKLKNGGVMEFTVASGKKALQQRAGELDSVFGHHAEGLFEIGPWPSLLGARPSDWPARGPAAGSVILADRQLLLGVRPGAPFVPRQVRGAVSGVPESALPLDLAVSVNGVVRATTRTLDIESFRNTFSALLPDDALAAGDNRVQVFAVSDPGDGPVLRELENTQLAPAWTLEHDGDNALLARDDGAVFPVADADAAFEVQSAQVEPGAPVTLDGATGTRDAGPVVLAFLDGRYAGSARVSGGRFTVRVAPPGGQALSAAEARVFLVDEAAGVAFEAAYPAPCAPQWLFAEPAAWAGNDCRARPGTPLAAVDGGYAAILQMSEAAATSYLGEGWGAPGGGITWSIGKSARTGIPLPSGLRALSMKATIKPFLHPPALPSQRLWITANGLPAGSWTLEDGRFIEISLTVPAAVLEPGPESLELEWFLPDAVSPKSLGAGEDLRALGIALLALEISAQ